MNIRIQYNDSCQNVNNEYSNSFPQNYLKKFFKPSMLTSLFYFNINITKWV